MEDILVGTKINRYELLECIDRTDLIGYFKAYDTKLERNVIIKLILHASNYSEDAIEYFLNESRALAKLNHPNIAKVLDFGFDSGNLYLITEYISGKSLSAVMNGALNWQQAVEILLPLTGALSYAHSKGVIHRDLKPDNITITEDGRFILSDFSLVKIIESEETRDMTGTKVGLGSPAYISPEQGKGQPADFRSDIYSLGVIFYEMVTGQKPFFQGSSMEIVIQHVTSEPPKPKSIVPTLPDSIERVILMALSKDIEKRFQSMQEFSDALNTALQSTSKGNSQQSNRFNFKANRVIMSALTLLIIAAIAGFSTWRILHVPPLSTSTVSGTDENTIYSSATSTASSDFIPIVTSQISITPTPPTESLTQSNTATTLNPGIAIDANASIARRETTNINTVGFIDDAHLVISGTDVGLYFYSTLDLSIKYFLDTKGPVSAIATSSDGTWIATGDQNGNVAVWNLILGSELARFEGHPGAIVSLSISRDKTKLVSAAGKTVYLWDINTKTLLFTFQKHAYPVNKVLFSPDGQYVISGGDDFQVMFWNADTGEFVKQYSSTQKINDISISPDSTTLALALNNATIEIRNYKDGQIRKTFEDQKIIDPYRFLKFLPSNSLLVSGSENGIIRVWNISGNLIWETLPTEKNINSLKALSVSDDGVKIVSLSNDNFITVWDIPAQTMQSSKELANVPIPNTATEKYSELVYSLPPVPAIAGAEIPKASAGLDKVNIKGITELARWGTPKINTISFIDNSQMMLAATSAGVYFYNAADLTLKYFFDTKGWLSTFCVSADGTLVATGDQNGNVAVWNIVDGQEVASFEGQSGAIISLAISPDKGQVASVNNSKVISLWDLSQKQLRFSLKKHALSVNKVLFSPDGQYVISGGDDFQVMFWNVDTGEFVKQYSSTQKINDISISPDSATLALALNNATIEIRNYRDGQIRKTFEDWKIVDPFTAIKFLPSNSLLVSGSENGIGRVWNINGNAIWETPKQDKTGALIGTGFVKSIAVSDDGVKFAILFDNNLINIWDINAKSLLLSKKLDYGPIQRVSVSPDNQLLAYQAGDSTVSLWSITSHSEIVRLNGSLPRGNPFSSNSEILVTKNNDVLLTYSLKSIPPSHIHTHYDFPTGGTVSYLLDDKIIAAAANGILKYWSLSSGLELNPSSPIKYERACRVFYRDDGQFLGAGSVNGVLGIETNLKYFCNVSRGPRTLSEDFLADGSKIALSLENQILEVWDVQSGDKKYSIKSQAKGNMLDVAISNDGKLLAAASASGIIEIYDLATYELIATFNVQKAPVTQILFTNDLKYLISASTDGTVRFWGLIN